MSKKKVNKTDIKGLFKARQDILLSNLSILLNHPTSKGDHCESAWIDFFRSFLPSRYAVDKGFVFDATGETSEQMDIIIYDALYLPLIFGTDSGEKYVTAESVYAVFEAKQKIMDATLNYANKKAQSVLKLNRTSRGTISSGKHTDRRALTNIMCGILAKDSITNAKLEKNLKKYEHINIGCAPNKTAFIVNSKYAENDRPFVQFSSPEQSILSFFFIVLDELHKQGTVGAIDVREYADNVLEKITFYRDDPDDGKATPAKKE